MLLQAFGASSLAKSSSKTPAANDHDDVTPDRLLRPKQPCAPAAEGQLEGGTLDGASQDDLQTTNKPEDRLSQTTTTTPSLFVGDLAPNVTDAVLLEIFSAFGPVQSARVLHDAVTRRSRGCAYVTYIHQTDAERAMTTLNLSLIQNRPCRVMWQQRDSSLRYAGAGGSIFIQTLPPFIDVPQLHETFSVFGTILSCKVVKNRETGLSRGIGNVHFATAEAVTAAIETMNGRLVAGQPIQVQHFVLRDERWTSCFVRNIPSEWDVDRLKQEFAQFGAVVRVVDYQPKSTAVTQKEDNGANDRDRLYRSYIEFAKHECAVAAVTALNGKEYRTVLDGQEMVQKIIVWRALRKTERRRELRARFAAEKDHAIFVKNLADDVTDDILRDNFNAIGTITAARVVVQDATNGRRSRGFGFVLFTSPEEATRAVNEMDGKLIKGKPICVALARRRRILRRPVTGGGKTRHLWSRNYNSALLVPF
jgi:polyadenylate-binding protein